MKRCVTFYRLEIHRLLRNSAAAGSRAAAAFSIFPTHTAGGVTAAARLEPFLRLSSSTRVGPRKEQRSLPLKPGPRGPEVRALRPSGPPARAFQLPANPPGIAGQAREGSKELTLYRSKPLRITKLAGTSESPRKGDRENEERREANRENRGQTERERERERERAILLSEE